MNEEAQGQGQSGQSGGLNLGDIYYVLFRHKWMIIFFSALGILAAAVVLIVRPPKYRSEAKLFISYVVEGKTLNPPGMDEPARRLNDEVASILNTETKILLSLDVARETAIDFGPEKVLAKAGGGTNVDQAAQLIAKSLEIDLPASSSVISLTFQHPDPEIAQQLLNQLILVYIKKHKETHRTVELFGSFVSDEVSRLRADLATTEQQLRDAKAKAGVTSLEESKKEYSEGMAKVRQDIFNTEAELAEHQAALTELPKLASTTNLVMTNLEVEIPWEQATKYRQVCSQLELLSKREQELLLQFKENNSFVQEIQGQIAETSKQKKKLEDLNPRLATMNTPARVAGGGLVGASIDPLAEAIQVRALKAKIEALNSQLTQIQAEVTRADTWETTILELQRKKDLQEGDLKYFSSSLEQSRIEDALGSGKAPNIRVIQSPSTPVKAWSKPFKKKVQMVAVGGVLAGVALAFLVELFLDRSVKRPVDVTGKLRLPLLISIPDYTKNGGRRAGKSMRGGDGGEAEGGTRALMRPLAAWDRDHPLHRFYEGLRDRLIVYFEVRNVPHKPKLVAVTSCGRRVGVSTIAGGLAASLSETGDGNVLLVDMNGDQGVSQPFYKGKPGSGLDDDLETETQETALVQSKVYGVTELSAPLSSGGVLPGRFASLMPKLKASQYDYIIFDMPPISQTSVTPRLARLMDMVLLVVESEKTSQDVAKLALTLLSESNANVSAVLNKTRTYVPARLHQELLDLH